MKIALNANALLAPRTGIGRYVAELARGLPRHGEVRAFQGLGWRAIGREPEDAPAAAPAAQGSAPAWHRILPALPGVRRLASGVQQVAFSAGVLRWRPQVYHEPAYLAFPFAGPLVVTAHDASWVRHPQTHPRERVRQMNRRLPAVLERADRVIVDSAFVADEMHTLFAVPQSKLRVIHLGVDAVFRPMTADQTAGSRAAHGLAHGGYILAVGTLEPRKNLTTLLAAYESLPAALRQRYPLVLVGNPGWGAGLDESRSARLQRQQCLIRTGYVPESALPGLYAGAALFVYPSLYEGFGLPPLEAMASGVPVVVSDRASLPEVVGAAGRQVAALDVDALAATIAELLQHPAQCAALALAGRARAAGFTWGSCVQRTFAVYSELCA